VGKTRRMKAVIRVQVNKERKKTHGARVECLSSLKKTEGREGGGSVFSRKSRWGLDSRPSQRKGSGSQNKKKKTKGVKVRQFRRLGKKKNPH